MKPSLIKEILSAVALSLAAAALTAVCVFVSAYLLFPLNGVRLAGAEMYQKSQAEKLVSGKNSIVTLNAERLQREVESDPWVESAEVRKDWGDGVVVVEVDERHAILNAEIDGRREVLASDGEELPGVGKVDLSPVKLADDEVPRVLEVSRKIEANGGGLESIDAVGPGGIEATVRGRDVILSDSVGADQARALEGVMERNPGARTFDLRSPGRVVVAAKSEDSDVTEAARDAEELEG